MPGPASGLHFALAAIPAGTPPEIVAAVQPLYTAIYNLFQQLGSVAGPLGSMALQEANAVNITGGVLTGTRVSGLTVSTTTGTLTIGNAKTAAINNTLSFSGTDSSSVNVGAGGTLGVSAYQAGGITGTLTTASLVGKTLTFTNGVITGFA